METFWHYVLTFLISMVPVIELRGAIPIGYYVFDLPIWPVVIVSILGNLAPVPFLILWGGKVLRWLATYPRLGKPFRWILKRGEKKTAKMQHGLFWGLFLFVAIPLPGTGAWTGSLVAITLGEDLKRAFLPIALGVLGAGAIILTIFYAFPELFVAWFGR